VVERVNQIGLLCLLWCDWYKNYFHATRFQNSNFIEYLWTCIKKFQIVRNCSDLNSYIISSHKRIKILDNYTIIHWNKTVHLKL
jgi:hypothetical protein